MRFKSNCGQGSWSKDSSLSRWFPKTSGPDAGEACFAVRRRKSVLLLPGFSPGGGGMRVFTRLAIALLVAGVVFLAAGRAQKPPLLPEKEVAALANELSGETAKRNLEGIARFHRQRGSKGFHEAAELVAERLRAYGLSDVAILQFPADGKIFYGTQRSRPAWDAEVGDLRETWFHIEGKTTVTPNGLSTSDRL